MCTAGISFQVMSDPVLQEVVFKNGLDFLHQQVLMMLYTLDHEKRLPEYRQLLPVYLAKDWEACDELLNVLEIAGVVRRSERDIELVHKIEIVDAASDCACHA
jgi:hypothetical protein